MYDEDKITLDRETFRALAVETRVEILKRLEERKLTLTDLSQKLNMSPSTVKEHLDRLVSAGLIEIIPGDTKWKYYKLTRKGRGILNPHETKVWFILAVSLISLVAVVYNLFSSIIAFNALAEKAGLEYAGGGGVIPAGAAENATKSAAESLLLAPKAAASTTTVIEALRSTAPDYSAVIAAVSPAEVAVALLLTLVVGLCVGLLLKKRML